MDAIILQILNGLDKGSAYALIALGLTLIFGTLGVVNFAHGALFMLGAFCAVTLNVILNISHETIDPTRTDFLGNPLRVQTPYVHEWCGPEYGAVEVLHHPLQHDGHTAGDDDVLRMRAAGEVL